MQKTLKVIVAGKGGVGKTTLAGTLARILAQRGERVLAMDVDSSPNLAVSLGLPQKQAVRVITVPRGLTEWRTDQEGNAYVHLNLPVSRFIEDYSIPAPNGVRLLVMGEVLEAGVGCRCEDHAIARGITAQILAEADTVIVDMEPGLEHLGRGTAEYMDAILIVVEPYFRSLMTAERIYELAVQLEIPHILFVANRVRNAKEKMAIEKFCQDKGFLLLAAIPYDTSIIEAEELGLAPVDHNPSSPAMTAISYMAEEINRSISNF
jgi:CO dehydrogenase maturation factor